MELIPKEDVLVGEVFILHTIMSQAAGVLLRYVVSPDSCEVVKRAGGR